MAGLQIYQPTDLEQMAAGLNYANGDDFESANGIEDMLEFNGMNTPSLTAEDGSRVFRINITNGNSGTNLRTLLHAGHRDQEPQRIQVVLDSNPSEVQDFVEIMKVRQGLVREGSYKAINSSLLLSAASGTVQPIQNILAYLRRHHVPINRIDMTADTNTQLTQALTIREINPFQEGQTKTIVLKDATNQNTFQDKTASIKTPGLVLHDNIEVELNVVPGTVSIALFCGAAANLGTLTQNVVNRQLRNRYGRR
jgi:hypothetical protein